LIIEYADLFLDVCGPCAFDKVVGVCGYPSRMICSSPLRFMYVFSLKKAAWYPDNPSREDERMISQFMNAFARFYPCTYCAKDFQDNLAKSPVKARSREDLSMWLCEQHNLVNEKLGKDLFKCDMKTLDERWRKSSDPRCES